MGKTMCKDLLKKISIVLLIAVVLSSAFGCNGQPLGEYYGKKYGLGAFSAIDYLPEIDYNAVCGGQSSYDRDGGNADGYGLVLSDGKNDSGEYSDSLVKRVLLDLQSPGIVYRMWFTNIGDVPKIKIYVDGEKKVDANLVDFVSGNIKPFVKPFVSDKEESSGGFVCYYPIAFSESIRIEGSGNFYCNIDYHTYPYGTEIEPFSENEDPSRALYILERIGEDPKAAAKYTLSEKFDINNNSSRSVTVNGKKSISAIRLSIPDVKVLTYDRTVYNETGRRLTTDVSVSFKIKIAGDGKLTAKMALLNKPQSFRVYVNNTSVGTVDVRQRRIDGFEWKDNDYFEDVEIPLGNLSGETNATITLTAISTCTFYKFVSSVGGRELDVFDIGSESSESKHSYKDGGKSAMYTKKAEYDPNTRISSGDRTKYFADEDMLKNVFIRIGFDGKKESVDVPVGMFFGFGMFGAVSYRTLMTGLKEDGTMYCYYPMPFENVCRIELVNKSDTDLKNVKITVDYKDYEGDMSTRGYFSTALNVYERGTTNALKDGEYYTILSASGAGKLVGVALSMSGDYFGEHSRFYLEGDAVLYVDGKISHDMHGTGTEDFFNGGWYFNNGTQVNPLFGCVAHNYRNNRDRTAMVRNMVTDSITWRNGINLVMEHGGNNNRSDCDVYALSYYYSSEGMLEKTDGFSVDEEKYTAVGANSATVQGSFEALYKNRVKSAVFCSVDDYSEFTVNLTPGNKGVILRRLMNGTILGQRAKVYVDGVFAGIWKESQRNALGYLRWEDYMISSSFTSNKESITVRLVNDASSDVEIIPWTESVYEIFCIK